MKCALKRLITRQINDDRKMRKLYFAICHHHNRHCLSSEVENEEKKGHFYYIFLYCSPMEIINLILPSVLKACCLSHQRVIFMLLYLTINSNSTSTFWSSNDIMNVNMALLFMSDQRFFIK